VPIIANLLDPRTAIVVMSIPVMCSNFMMLLASRGSRALARRIGVLLGSLVLGTLAGAQLLATLDLRALSVLIGLTAVVFVGLHALGANLLIPAKREGPLSIGIGLLSGVLGGSTNIYGPVLAAYLHTLRLAKADFVFAITLLFMVGNGTQVLSYLRLGLYSPSVLVLSVLACLPMALGILLGLRLQHRLSARMWNRLVLVVIFLSGLNLLARGLLGV
jgi:uncharacterized membrane protein YfcA